MNRSKEGYVSTNNSNVVGGGALYALGIRQSAVRLTDTEAGLRG